MMGKGFRPEGRRPPEAVLFLHLTRAHPPSFGASGRQTFRKVKQGVLENLSSLWTAAAALKIF